MAARSVVEDRRQGVHDPGATVGLRDSVPVHGENRSQSEAAHLRARRGPPVWLVHPLKRTHEVLRLADGRFVGLTTLKDDAVAQAEPFDAVPSRSPHLAAA